MTRLPRAKCGECGRNVAVRTDGTLREHWPVATPRERQLYSTLCPGSGFRPQQTKR